MRTFDSDPVPVPLGACYCPGTPHEEDTVYLAPALPMAGGMAAQAIINEGLTDPIKLQEGLAELWIRHGVVGWNLVDEDGRDLPLDRATVIRALPYGKGGRLVAERADDLYAEDILAPLAERLSLTSKRGASNGSTSRRATPTSTRSSRSSTATTARARRRG
jgi:hypothetical protein